MGKSRWYFSTIADELSTDIRDLLGNEDLTDDAFVDTANAANDAMIAAFVSDLNAGDEALAAVVVA